MTKTAFIVPTRLDWLALLAMIGVFGFIAQVRRSAAHRRYPYSSALGPTRDGLATGNRW